jgi:hypothetical protein
VAGGFYLGGQLFVVVSCCVQQAGCSVDHADDLAGGDVWVLVCESLFDAA